MRVGRAEQHPPVAAVAGRAALLVESRELVRGIVGQREHRARASQGSAAAARTTLPASRSVTTRYQAVSFETTSNPRHGPLPQPVKGRRGWNGCASTACPPSTAMAPSGSRSRSSRVSARDTPSATTWP